MGANHGLALHPVDASGEQLPGEAASCFASFWMAEWSRWGTGNALIVATLQGWRSYGSNEFFAATLAAELTRRPGAPSVYPGPRGPSSSGYMAVAESWVM